MKPTEEDMRRDLASDLHYVNAYGMVQASHAAPWRAAIRRALAAESKLDVCRDDWQAAVEERDEAIGRAEEAEAEAARLRKMVEGLSERVAQQSELLSRRAERIE